MKSLTQFINEATKIRPIKTTVGEYLAWYFGVDHVDEIDPVDDFQSTDFDPESLEKHFKGSYTAQYEFLADHFQVIQDQNLLTENHQLGQSHQNHQHQNTKLHTLLQ